MTCLDRVTGLLTPTALLWPLSQAAQTHSTCLALLKHQEWLHKSYCDLPNKLAEAAQQSLSFANPVCPAKTNTDRIMRQVFGSLAQGISHFNILMLRSPFTEKKKKKKQEMHWQKGLSRLLLMRSCHFTVTLMFDELMQSHTVMVLVLGTSPLRRKILLYQYFYSGFLLIPEFSQDIVSFHQDNPTCFRVMIIMSESAVTVSMLVYALSRLGLPHKARDLLLL